MITYEEYQKLHRQIVDIGQVRVPIGVKCPNCDSELYRDHSIVYTTYPPKYKYLCVNCGWEKVNF